MKRHTSLKDYEKQLSGGEPTWDVAKNNQNITLTTALNWYSSFSDAKEAKKYVIHYLKIQKKTKTEIGKFEKLHEKTFGNLGFMCRIFERGGPITKEQIDDRLTKIKEEIPKTTKKTKTVETPKINIQDRILEKSREYMGEIEGMIDDCVHLKIKDKIDAFGFMQQNQVKPPHARYIIEVVNRKLDEINEVILGKDKQLVEGYSNFNKTELKKFSSLLSSIIDDANRIVHNSKITRKPRTKKNKPIEKIISTLQYKKADNEYKIASVDPTGIIGASQLWVFNTKTRKLGCYNAIDESGFNIKGTTLTNFSEKNSIQKIVRKPEEILPNVLKASKVASKKILPGLTTSEQTLTGRLNSDTILLKIIK